MVIKTIVTTEMIDKIAQDSGVNCYNVLTGFKWIAEMIREKEGKENYVIGGEESFGLMIGDKVRDKDAVSAVALLCEMAAYEKEKGRSLFEKLLDLYVKHGFYLEDLISITKKGMDGQKQIAAMMETFRNNPPTTIDGTPIAGFLDYEKGTVRIYLLARHGKLNCRSRMCCNSYLQMEIKSLPVHPVLNRRSSFILASMLN